MTATRPLLELTLMPVEAPDHATSGARVYVLLPSLPELVGMPGFGSRNPISVRGARDFDALSFFAPYRAKSTSLH